MLDTCVSGSVVVGSIFFFDRLAGKSNLVGASDEKATTEGTPPDTPPLPLALQPWSREEARGSKYRRKVTLACCWAR